MTSEEYVFKPQNVNYLGFLEAQLRDLTGIDTLAYELIQNADDVQDENGRFPTTHLTFDITDDALIVENNGVFRPVDFERLQNLAGGGKRDEAGTTGAFGIGFVAVYQITDAPEIFSNGLHWTIHPEAEPEQRIIERKIGSTSGTSFRLPWAFDMRSPVRQALRIEAIQPTQLDLFAERIAEAVETAALFLQKLQVLQVKRNGRLLQKIERLTSAKDEIVLQAGRRATTWMLLRGNFGEKAAQLREKYPWQIEEKRRSEVRLAIPLTQLDQPGRLFAVLPTDSTTPLPLHINADFYPTNDRKRIHFGTDYQSEWNRAAIECAALVLAAQFDTLPQLLGPVNFWDLLQKMAYTHQLADEGDLPKVFTAFWGSVLSQLSTEPILYTADEQWRLPADVRLLARGTGETAVSLLNNLQIPTLHPDLNAHSQLMKQPEIGAATLSINDLVAALQKHGLADAKPLFEAPPFLRDTNALQSLWALIDKLLLNIFHPQQVETALSLFKKCAIVLTDSMELKPFHRVYQGKSDAKLLFPDAIWLHDMVPTDSFPGRYVQQFGVRQAVDLLKEMPFEQREHAWRMGRLDVPGIFRWFEANQIEIFADDPALQAEIRRLPLVPVDGELRPLSHLFIPGGFVDPLNLSGTVDMALVGGRPHFLRDLGVRELEFDTYLYEQLPRILQQHVDIPSDARYQLTQLLAERLGEFRDDAELQAQYSDLPLVACLDGSFRSANQVYASRDVQQILGELVHIAEPVESSAIKALHRWLGVRQEASTADIVQALLAASQKWGNAILDESAQQRVWQGLLQLNLLLQEGVCQPTELAPLKEKAVLPNKNWRLASGSDLFVLDQVDLANAFLDLDDVLLLDGAAVAMVTAVLGIKPLSQAVTVQVVDVLNAVESDTIQQLLRERRPLIDRILQAEAAPDGGFNTSFLENVRVLKMPELQIQYWLTVKTQTFKSEPEFASVKFDRTTHVLYVEEKPSWALIARELAFVIKQGRAFGSLALGIKEVLAANTFGSAARILDELGIL
jgi:hypothetical protein